MTTLQRDNTAGKGMVLTERDRRLIAEVAEFGILTRDQIARHLQFGSVTRVNAVLLRLARHGYLTRRVQPTLRGTRRQTYLIGPRGAELLEAAAEGGRQARRKWQECSDLFVEHRLLVNEVRLAMTHSPASNYQLRRWIPELQLRQMNLGLVPDGFAEYALEGKTYNVFVEADNGTEPLGRWRQKVEGYTDLAFSGRYQAAFGRQYFRVLALFPNPRRLSNVQGEIARHTEQLFWLSTFEELRERGLLGPIWRRPRDATRQTLTP